MAGRCPANALLLPFLYPPLFPRHAITAFPRCRVRHHITEAATDAAWTRLNPAPDDYAITNFADKTNLTVCAGGGGNAASRSCETSFSPTALPTAATVASAATSSSRPPTARHRCTSLPAGGLSGQSMASPAKEVPGMDGEAKMSSSLFPSAPL